MNALTTISPVVLMITSREIATIANKRHDNVTPICLDLRDSGVCPEIKETLYINEQNGQTYKQYVLNERDSYVLIARLSPEFTARLVDRWQELESKQPKFNPTTLTRIDILKLAMDSEEGRIKAEAERDIAIATKAQIGSKREASAMATARHAAKKANSLEIELDRSKYFATVKRMEMLCHGQKFNWRLLKSASIEMGIQSIDVFDANYGTVKAYHADVWREAYAIDLFVLLEVNHA